jgi:hypothetical protein
MSALLGPIIDNYEYLQVTSNRRFANLTNIDPTTEIRERVPLSHQHLESSFLGHPTEVGITQPGRELQLVLRQLFIKTTTNGLSRLLPKAQRF